MRSPAPKDNILANTKAYRKQAVQLARFTLLNPLATFHQLVIAVETVRLHPDEFAAGDLEALEKRLK